MEHLFYYYFFIVVQVQFSAFSPHPSTPPQPFSPPSPKGGMWKIFLEPVLENIFPEMRKLTLGKLNNNVKPARITSFSERKQ